MHPNGAEMEVLFQGSYPRMLKRFYPCRLYLSCFAQITLREHTSQCANRGHGICFWFKRKQAQEQQKQRSYYDHEGHSETAQAMSGGRLSYFLGDAASVHTSQAMSTRSHSSVSRGWLRSRRRFREQPLGFQNDCLSWDRLSTRALFSAAKCLSTDVQQMGRWPAESLAFDG